MRNPLFIVVFGLVTFLSAEGITQAQPGGDSLFNTGRLGLGLLPGKQSLQTIINNKNVKKHLELTDKQMEELANLQKKMKDDAVALNDDITKKQRKAREEANKEEVIRLNEMKNTITDDLYEQGDRLLEQKILTKKQGKRLRELRLQAEGVKAFARPEVQAELALTDEQLSALNMVDIQELRDIRKAAVMPTDVIRPKPGVENSVETKKYQSKEVETKSNVLQARISAIQAAKKILTNAQKTKYNNLVGKQFDFQAVAPKEPVTKDQSGGQAGGGTDPK